MTDDVMQDLQACGERNLDPAPDRGLDMVELYTKLGNRSLMVMKSAVDSDSIIGFLRRVIAANSHDPLAAMPLPSHCS
ncbi:hypothetical protein AJ87_15775 [Rhizobium yanglingense]|nr:hypothetical protein AJ87_15775 [Rhizobium yanglingense]